jgi:hypothetical protein
VIKRGIGRKRPGKTLVALGGLGGGFGLPKWLGKNGKEVKTARRVSFGGWEVR